MIDHVFLVGMLCMTQPISQTNEELRLLAACMAHLNDMVVVTDTSGVDEPNPKIVYVNDAFLRCTGYSSLAYLRKLPISVLKIDRTFVRDIEVNDGDKAICQTILALGRTLKLAIVAEGVGTDAQFAYLDAHGCNSFQGFLFGKAHSLNAFEDRFFNTKLY